MRKGVKYKHKQTINTVPKSTHESRHITAPEPVWGESLRIRLGSES